MPPESLLEQILQYIISVPLLFSLVWPHSSLTVSVWLCVQLIFKVVMQAASLRCGTFACVPFC